MRKFIYFLTLSLSLLFYMQANAAANLTAEQVAQKAAAVVSQSSGIKCSFTINTNGHSSKGQIISSGSKFSVTMPQMSSWYNGKSLYTYNPRTSETTLINPTAQELLESNPLLYVKGGAAGYSYSFSPVKRNGKYVVDLTPRNARSGVKKLTFTINASNFHVERIAVTTKNGSSTIDITGFTSGISLPASSFEYPKSKFANAEIVDLR